MAQKPIEMTQIKQVKMLYNDKVPIKEIARRLGLSKNTVKKYLRRLKSLEEAPFADDGKQSIISNKELAAVAYDNDVNPLVSKRMEDLIDHFSTSLADLSKTGVTKQLLWAEYKQSCPDGYQYSQYCSLLNKYLDDHDASYHKGYRPGEFIECDFAGKKMSYIDKESGQTVVCETFVAILPHSGLTFCYAVASQKTADFSICIREMLKYFGGVTQTILVDNFRTAVTKSDRYHPVFTSLCYQMADHYGTTFSATRPAHPSDKGAVEKAVDIVYQQIYAPLRKDLFYSLQSLNASMRKQLDQLNLKPYKGDAQSRGDNFIRSEQSKLKELPESHFELMKTKNVQVQRNYAIQLSDNNHYYTVPYRLVGKRVDVYFNSRVLEVYYQHERVAFHVRRSGDPRFNRIHEHMPKNHQAMEAQKGWTVDQLQERATAVGPYTAQIASRMLHSSIYPEQNFKACNALLLLQNVYSRKRLEGACKHASIVARPTLKMIREILRTNQDQAPTLFEEEKPLPKHSNIRGKEYYH